MPSFQGQSQENPTAFLCSLSMPCDCGFCTVQQYTNHNTPVPCAIKMEYKHSSITFSRQYHLWSKYYCTQWRFIKITSFLSTPKKHADFLTNFFRVGGGGGLLRPVGSHVLQPMSSTMCCLIAYLFIIFWGGLLGRNLFCFKSILVYQATEAFCNMQKHAIWIVQCNLHGSSCTVRCCPP